MARRRSGMGSRRSFSTSTKKQSPPPTPTSRAPPPSTQRQGGGLFSGLMGTVLQGAAFGTGSSLAHRAVDGVMGGRGEDTSSQHIPAEPGSGTDVCKNQAKAFTDCMTENNGDMAACQYYFDTLQQCKLTSTDTLQ